jgi:predicted permease
LIVACANIANLLVARSTSQSREFAVRAALGASRGDLLRRSLAESMILGLIGWGSGVVLAYWCVSLLRSFMPRDIPRADSITVNAGGLLFAIILSLAATVLFGSFPALRSMVPNLLQVLKPAGSSGSVGGSGRRLREVMVVTEVALAVVLLVVAGLVLRSFERLSGVDPGFRQDDVVSVAVPLPGTRYARAEWRGFFERFTERMAEVPGVVRVGGVSDLPMSSVGLGFEQEFTVPGLDALSPASRPNADLRLTLPGYFEAMAMEIVAGRSFDRLDMAGERRIAVVNETLVRRYFKDLDPVGRTLDIEFLGEIDIVGVVADIRHGGLLAKHESEVYLPYGMPIATSEMHIVVQSDLSQAVIAAAATDILRDMDPELAATEVVAVADLLWQSVARPRFNTALLSGLALCAALLAMVGVYGIVAFTVARRRNEIGIRMALGADSRATAAMVVRQALIVVAIGAGFGVLLALGASRFLGRLLFEIEPTDPVTYGVIVAAALLVGLLAALAPARRATRIDPVSALRDD